MSLLRSCVFTAGWQTRSNSFLQLPMVLFEQFRYLFGRQSVQEQSQLRLINTKAVGQHCHCRVAQAVPTMRMLSPFLCVCICLPALCHGFSAITLTSLDFESKTQACTGQTTGVWYAGL